MTNFYYKILFKGNFNRVITLFKKKRVANIDNSFYLKSGINIHQFVLIQLFLYHQQKGLFVFVE